MEKKIASVNLLRNKQANPVDRFISWALTIGRLLVILVELVALGAFLYRFSLDKQLIDLHSKIKQEQTVVTFLKDNEDRFRNLQDRLDIASNFADLSTQKAKIFSDVLGFAEQGMAYNNLTVSEDRIKIVANVDSVKILSSFVDKLRSYPYIDTVSIDKIENRPASAAIGVSITAILKTEKNKYAVINK